MQFINDNIIVTDARVIQHISEDELKQKLCDAVKTHLGEKMYKELFERASEDENDPLPWGQAVSMLLNCSDSIYWGKGVEVNHENIYFYDWQKSVDSDKYLGVHTIDGFTFCGVLTGGDWEWPLFLILYWDGVDIRVYIPKRGNKVNVDTMTAFGSEGEVFGDGWNDMDEISKCAKEKYKHLSTWTIPDDADDYIDWSEPYIKQYGFDKIEDVFYNWEAMMEEIFVVFK